MELEIKKKNEILLTIPIDGHFGETITQQIEGELNCIIFNFPVQCDLKIYSEYGYPIYTSSDSVGVNYISPRADTFEEDGKLRNFQAAKFVLNERLIIQVSPRQNIPEVKLII